MLLRQWAGPHRSLQMPVSTHRLYPILQRLAQDSYLFKPSQGQDFPLGLENCCRLPDQVPFSNRTFWWPISFSSERRRSSWFENPESVFPKTGKGLGGPRVVDPWPSGGSHCPWLKGARRYWTSKLVSGKWERSLCSVGFGGTEYLSNDQNESICSERVSIF